MMRRAITNVSKAGVRCNSSWAKPDFVKVFESDFAAAEYPERAVGGGHLLFSKLMYQLATKENKGEAYLKSLESILTKEKLGSLSPHWRTETNVGEDKEFADVEAGVKFTLRWMQTSAQMDKFDDVAKIFQIYVKAAQKTVVATITLPGLPESNGKLAEAAKAAATQQFKEAFPAKAKEGWKLEFSYLVDPGILAGWRAEVGSYVLEDMKVYLAARAAAETESHGADFLAGPKEQFTATAWPATPETEIMGDWCDELAQFDAEEARFGA